MRIFVSGEIREKQRSLTPVVKQRRRKLKTKTVNDCDNDEQCERNKKREEQLPLSLSLDLSGFVLMASLLSERREPKSKKWDCFGTFSCKLWNRRIYPFSNRLYA